MIQKPIQILQQIGSLQFSEQSIIAPLKCLKSEVQNCVNLLNDGEQLKQESLNQLTLYLRTNLQTVKKILESQDQNSIADSTALSFESSTLIYQMDNLLNFSNKIPHNNSKLQKSLANLAQKQETISKISDQIQLKTKEQQQHLLLLNKKLSQLEQKKLKSESQIINTSDIIYYKNILNGLQSKQKFLESEHNKIADNIANILKKEKLINDELSSIQNKQDNSLLEHQREKQRQVDILQKQITNLQNQMNKLNNDHLQLQKKYKPQKSQWQFNQPLVIVDKILRGYIQTKSIIDSLCGGTQIELYEIDFIQNKLLKSQTDFEHGIKQVIKLLQNRTGLMELNYTMNCLLIVNSTRKHINIQHSLKVLSDLLNKEHNKVTLTIFDYYPEEDSQYLYLSKWSQRNNINYFNMNYNQKFIALKTQEFIHSFLPSPSPSVTGEVGSSNNVNLSPSSSSCPSSSSSFPLFSSSTLTEIQYKQTAKISFEQQNQRNLEQIEAQLKNNQEKQQSILEQKQQIIMEQLSWQKQENQSKDDLVEIAKLISQKEGELCTVKEKLLQKVFDQIATEEKEIKNQTHIIECKIKEINSETQNMNSLIQYVQNFRNQCVNQIKHFQNFIQDLYQTFNQVFSLIWNFSGNSGSVLLFCGIRLSDKNFKLDPQDHINYSRLLDISYDEANLFKDQIEIKFSEQQNNFYINQIDSNPSEYHSEQINKLNQLLTPSVLKITSQLKLNKTNQEILNQIQKLGISI